MTSFFANKVVAVTGGSDGIGKALVDALINAGAKVATCGRHHDKLYNLQMEYPNILLHTVVCDVSVEADCKRFIESTVETLGEIDILINNAGVSMRALVEDTSSDVIKKVMDINFFGAVYCSKCALPSILKNKGTIVGISSIAGYRGLPGRSGYCASKFALQGWLESLKVEVMDKGVHVMWVSPGFTTSNIRHASLTKDGSPQGDSTMEEGKLMSAADCAHFILDAIKKKKRTLVLTLTGKRAIFMNKFFPAFADKMVHKFYFKAGKLVK